MDEREAHSLIKRVTGGVVSGFPYDSNSKEIKGILYETNHSKPLLRKELRGLGFRGAGQPKQEATAWQLAWILAWVKHIDKVVEHPPEAFYNYIQEPDLKQKLIGVIRVWGVTEHHTQGVILSKGEHLTPTIDPHQCILLRRKSRPGSSYMGVICTISNDCDALLTPLLLSRRISCRYWIAEDRKIEYSGELIGMFY